ncbi:Ppx/GppA phosphatase family protein [Hyphomonas sp.]|uniref:Ppx/GppA phosphatase family protein n=1 Tax=Hyphomonas sp. TaxID=87 RepID=UPI0025C311B9|nr:Ppx/GppA phosphatase family protein [Hyphomonas sp.]
MADKKTAARRGKRGRPRPAKPADLYAAVDLGTNNCRLLVATPHGKTFRVVDSHSQIARLGEGLHETGRLSDASIERALDALKAIRRKLKSHGVGKVRCIATEACRKAENGAEFIQRVHEETGLTFKIIGAKEEARLASIGCHDLIGDDAPSVLVVDIGGGSTELSWLNAELARANGLHGLIQRAPIQNWTSLPLGVVTLTEAYAHLPDADAYQAMLDHCGDVIETWQGTAAIRSAMKLRGAHLIGTSGTVTCLAGVHLKLDRYRRDRVDGTWMNRTAGEKVLDMLRAAGPEGRAALPTIGEERAGLMLAGCAILDALWRAYPAGRLRVGDRGLREGLLLSMMYGKKPSRRNRRGGGGKRRNRDGRDTPSASEAGHDG